MSVFVDTSALYALLVRTEDGHADAAAAFRDLIESGRSLTTSNYVVVETTALLQHRLGLEPVRDLNSRLLPLLRLMWISPESHRKAAERHVRADRRRLSLVDCSSFVVMDAEGIRDALTLDDDFRQEGYNVLPAAR